MSTHDHDHSGHDPSGHDHAGHDHGHPHEPAGGPLADASVRRARPNDAPAVGMVQATVFREAYAGRVPDEVVALFEPDAFARTWRESLTAPPGGIHRLMVACAGDQVVGLAAVGPSQDPDAEPAWGEVTVLGVHPDARRQGHGSRLLNATVDILREAGADAVALWVLADDEPGRAFLTASGFAPDGAYRDRVVSPDGDTLREVRLRAHLGEGDAPTDTGP
ncbi:GNAT family N-acetyltransferase [Oryzobacter telluris]|uniref:GNAT family N-acetyltransferase n=1 Tax=Oryzobacter telluris TaxID=3149179 RepID=UPI00370D99FD